ncbi:CRISPR-associated helicase Cas3' [Testudinibacter sp. TR-2022]|uniref:CRISPR-associated helicase Cas3' n=1 Tax=Testudinibacter sp. TR-2022 TaxID=2585029 RepID=UPI00111BC334|nr:CRISPR-associated helicase Cas3' [Testudinibacter sp. TR-2022]TNH07692.1 CRISPR-associated helicase Cas3' [Pasteurellaceae bacterium Phil11]TNH23081.1 CRISPR-associated helicase Cas3' [Testudinibacter sp. TR-2022]TNH25224.1 CRISPR-associated helicase Cas3' [Testudinibacter sp. TR-2022]
MSETINTTVIYYAHSAANQSYEYWQTLHNHSYNVGEIAAGFARFFAAGEIARCTGQLHDVGKYSPEFNQRLHGAEKRVDHATAGAKLAAEKWGLIGKLMAFCIAGHHAGLANGAGEGDNRRTLQARLALQFGHDIPKLDAVWQQEIHLPGELAPPPLKPSATQPAFSLAFFTRMLYSCLVDADFLDTEAFYHRLENQANQRGDAPDLAELQQAFNAYLAAFRQRVTEIKAKTEAEKRKAAVNRLRSEVLDYAVEQAALPKGLFTLTVPTGGGKTFTSMAFALEHAKRYGMRRVIYVIPFTSIIEQNAAEFRKAFGDLSEAAVLEHHSTFDDEKLHQKTSKDKLRLASENWDMPIVVTTAVQFFESLFADRSSRCRKLHNISGSVIILDEAQMLPLDLLRPIMAAIDELARNYHCSVVMCTATQPAIHASHGFYQGFDDVREIAPNPEQLFEQLRRTTVKHIGTQTDSDLLEKLTAQPQMLIIVNNRRHARTLYDSAKHLEGVFHLTTLMCAKHRSQKLDEIRQKLQAGEPCRVIATSLIEAGVDVDFPLVMRAEAGLDSVAQAAGRCNREGKRLPEASMVWIFKPEDQWQAPSELGLLAASMRSTVRHHAADLLSPAAISTYFTSVYDIKGDELDKKKILDSHHKAGSTLDFPFQTIAQQFRMIENHMQPLIVPFNQEAETLIESLHHADQVGGLLRQLQPYTVQIPESVLAKLYQAGRIEVINQDKFGKQFYNLIGLDLYDDVAGLSWEDVDFIKMENSVI